MTLQVRYCCESSTKVHERPCSKIHGPEFGALGLYLFLIITKNNKPRNKQDHLLLVLSQLFHRLCFDLQAGLHHPDNKKGAQTGALNLSVEHKDFSLHPIGIKLVVKPDYKLVLDPVGRRTQVPAWPHGMFENIFLCTLYRGECLNFLALGDSDGAGILQHGPGRIFIDFGFLGIDNFTDSDLLVLKKLLSIFAGRSTFTQICPVNLHLILLLHRYC